MLKESDQKMMAALCHFSPFIGLGLLLPFVVWMWQKDQSEYMKRHSSQSLIFHVFCFAITSVVATLGFALSFITAGLGVFLFVPLFLVFLAAISIPSIVAGLRCLKGEDYQYPICGAYAERL